MRDKAYRRDLKRAVGEVVKEVKSIAPGNNGHLVVEVVMPDGTDSTFSSSASPRDHQFSINATVKAIKKRIRGTYK